LAPPVRLWADKLLAFRVMDSREARMLTPDSVRKALRAVKDPELNLNIIDIGLVYDIEVGTGGEVEVRMTLTSPGCPAGTEIIDDVKRVVADMEGVKSVEVELVWDPYWTPERMDPRVRAFLGF
jgi:metal-sulfur cluster biosynthetic enzyme